jgi:uncharacterized protein (TIGR02284 family)
MNTPTPTPKADKDVVLVLNQLIETCTDGEKGYAIAAADVRDAGLKIALGGWSDERAAFVKELRALVAKIGGAPESEGTLRGTLHRTLMQLREALEIRSDRLVLEECERGDRAALETYDNALRRLPKGVDPAMRAAIERQTATIRASLGELWNKLSIH